MENGRSMLCMAEDRVGAEVGIRIGVLSIHRHCPGTQLTIFRPRPTPEFVAWLKDFPNVRLVTEALPNASSWNCKPHALLAILREGFDEAIWFDSDMMLARDYRPLFAPLSDDTIAFTHETVSLLN